MSIHPHQAFQIYHGVFLHFTTDYNYQLFNGKTTYPIEKFDTRKDKYTFHKVARLYDDPKQLEYYMAWLFFTREKVYPRSICSAKKEFEKDWLEWHKDRYVNFTKDVEKIRDLTLKNDSMNAYELVLQDEIHMATFLVLDKFIDLISPVNEKMKGKYMWDKAMVALKKFKPFYHEHEPINEMLYRNATQHLMEK